MTVASNASGEARIELRLRELAQLFDSFDPAPFHEKDLDRDAEEFIVSWAREFPVDAPLVLRLHLPRDQERFEPQRTVQDAVRNYFAYRAELAGLEVRRTLSRAAPASASASSSSWSACCCASCCAACKGASGCTSPRKAC